MADGSKRRIVVGIDGSEDSKEALRWALEQARRTGAEIDAVTAWEVPLTIMVVPTYTEEDYVEHARQVLQGVLDEIVGPVGDVAVHARVVEGRAARVLAHTAANADMLVVGSHGRGELPGMHLGSVASYCVHHAPCPVVVLRGAAP